MEESEFVQEFYEIAEKILSESFIIKCKSNLIYELSLDQNLELNITNDLKSPKRGSSAFQTDICIYEKVRNVEFPRLVIEFKTGITTHDVLTYSSKAGKHKSIYPALRYGLLASEIESIPNRFFKHNEHIDFFIAAKKYRASQSFDFIKVLIKKEIKISQMLENIHFAKKNYDYYRRDIIFDNFE